MNTFQIFLISWIIFCIILVGLTAYFVRKNQNKKTNMDTSKVTRVEVIDHQSHPIVGRAYVKSNCQNVSLQLQDEGRTLKIFIGSGGLLDKKQKTESPIYTGGSDFDISVTFKDKDGNIGTITSDSITGIEEKLKQAAMAGKVMGDIFNLVKQKQ